MYVAGFSENAKYLFSAASVDHFSSVNDISPKSMAEAGITFCISDYDGVLSPYGGPANIAALDWLAEVSEELPLGAAIVSNNPKAAQDIKLPRNVSLHTAKAMHPWSFKPLPHTIQQALREHGASPENTAAFGDGGTDIIAYKLSRIGRVGIVKSLGAPWAQEIVRKKVYTPFVVPVGAALLRASGILKAKAN